MNLAISFNEAVKSGWFHIPSSQHEVITNVEKPLIYYRFEGLWSQELSAERRRRQFDFSSRISKHETQEISVWIFDNFSFLCMNSESRTSVELSGSSCGSFEGCKTLLISSCFKSRYLICRRRRRWGRGKIFQLWNAKCSPNRQTERRDFVLFISELIWFK